MLTLSYAIRELERRRLLTHSRAGSGNDFVLRVEALIGAPLPPEAIELYRAEITSIGEFAAVLPAKRGSHGWQAGADDAVRSLLHVDALPLFFDGCGNLFGLDLTAGASRRAVYFFDHERGFAKPEYAVGSSIPAFLLVLADHDRAIAERWPQGWELEIDPDLDKCPRAPPIWLAS